MVLPIPITPRDYLLGLSYPDLKAHLVEDQITHLIISPSVQFINRYFEDHAGYQKLAELDGFTIYQIDLAVISTDNSQIETCLGEGTSEYLSKLQKDFTRKFQQKLTTQYTPWMGLNENDLLALSAWDGCTVPVK